MMSQPDRRTISCLVLAVAGLVLAVLLVPVESSPHVARAEAASGYKYGYGKHVSIIHAVSYCSAPDPLSSCHPFMHCVWTCAHVSADPQTVAAATVPADLVSL